MQKYVLQVCRIYWAVVVVLYIYIYIYIVFIVRSSVICVQMCVTSQVQRVSTCSRLIVLGLSQDVIYIYVCVCVRACARARARVSPVSHLFYLNLMELFEDPNPSLCWEQYRQTDRQLIVRVIHFSLFPYFVAANIETLSKCHYEVHELKRKMEKSIFEDPLHYFCLILAFTFFIFSLPPPPLPSPPLPPTSF